MKTAPSDVDLDKVSAFAHQIVARGLMRASAPEIEGLFRLVHAARTRQGAPSSANMISEVIGAVLNERNLYIVKPQHPTMGEVALEAYGFGKACDAVALQGDDLQALLSEIGARCAALLNGH